MFGRFSAIFLFLLTAVVAATNFSVAEQARGVEVRLADADRGISHEQALMHDLAANYAYAELAALQNVRTPGQKLAQAQSQADPQMSDAPAVQLASLSMLPRRGEAVAQVHQISAPAGTANEPPMLVKISAGN